MKKIHVAGKRKRAIAMATLVPGNGTIVVNDVPYGNQFAFIYKQKILEPVVIAGETGRKVNVDVCVRGGGVNAQAEASRLAIGRALVQFDKKLERTFLDYDRQLLVADVRRKETRKPNTHGKARSKRQKSYR